MGCGTNSHTFSFYSEMLQKTDPKSGLSVEAMDPNSRMAHLIIAFDGSRKPEAPHSFDKLSLIGS